MSGGVTLLQLAASLQDAASPLAVKRVDILLRNPKVGRVLLVQPIKAPRLARQIARISQKSSITREDLSAMNAAARRRAKRCARNLRVASAQAEAEVT